MSEPVGLLILGYGGHARSVADVAIACGIRHLMFVDAHAREGESFIGHPVGVDWPALTNEHWACLPASGDNKVRRAQIDEAARRGWPVATLVSPRATVGVGASVGEGCFIAHHAHIGPMACIGAGCIINTGAAVEHESRIGDYSHVSVNATVAGRSSVGRFGFIGAGATIIDRIDICDEVIIGAGSVVTRHIDRPGTYVGSPVRRARN